MSSSSDDNSMPKCAACGKGGDGLKTCNACKLVKYCNATCKKKHRSKHKKKCQRRAAEIFDEALFRQPQEREECPICMLPLPKKTEVKYQPCCGKTLCDGCIYAAYKADRRQLCPFCRTPETSLEEEALGRLKKRVGAGDAKAIRNLGCLYDSGAMGVPQDYEKAVELWMQAGELGCDESYFNIAVSYDKGEGVERDEKKERYYLELAAMKGHMLARYNLGCMEMEAGNINRAVKHWMISAGAGDDNSLEAIRQFFLHGGATKDDFEKALHAHQEAKDEMKSDQRETASAIQRN